MNFTNVIATKDPDAPRRVVLSAHYDSKYFPTYPQNQVRPTAFFFPSCVSPAHRLTFVVVRRRN